MDSRVATVMLLLALAAQAAPPPPAPPKVEMELVAPPAISGTAAPVAVVLKVPPGWHIYWKNPGQSGIPTAIDLKWTSATSPAGPAHVGPLRWPTPTRFVADGLVNYGYDGDVAFVSEVTVPGLGGREATLYLEATASWLLCRDICVTGSGEARGVLRYAPEPMEPPPAPDPIAPLRGALPSPFATSGGTSAHADGQLRVTMPGPGPFEVFPSLALEAAWAPTITTSPQGALVLTSPLPSVPDAHLVLTRGAGAARVGFTLDLPESP